jgi:hypothetical protein
MIPCRQLLVSALTIYVNWRGSDYNDGLSPQTAVQTIAAAVELFTTKYDTGGLNHFIVLAGGFYDGCNMYDFVGGGRIEIIGSDDGSFVKGNFIFKNVKSNWRLNNLIFEPEGNSAIYANNGNFELGEGIIFNVTQATTPAMLYLELGSIVTIRNNFSIVYTTGVLPTFCLVRSKSVLNMFQITATITGALNWLTAAFWAQSDGLIDARSFTVSGADPSTGLRWIQESGGIILSDGATEIPGDTDGATALVTQTEPAAFPQADIGFNIPITLDDGIFG